MSTHTETNMRVARDQIRVAKHALDRQARHHRRLARAGHPHAERVGDTLADYNRSVMRAQDALRRAQEESR